jgi:hypothetical protein
VLPNRSVDAHALSHAMSGGEGGKEGEGGCGEELHLDRGELAILSDGMVDLSADGKSVSAPCEVK